MPDADSPADIAAVIARENPDEFPEGRRFAIESAGLSALTQMEWALRCAGEVGKYDLCDTSAEVNREIIRKIWLGEEDFSSYPETEIFRERLQKDSSKLFKAYEILLLAMGRDRNLADAVKNPEKWRVPGSLEFLKFLHRNQVKNYFITGAVIEYDAAGNPAGTMVEEISALHLAPSPGGIVEKLIGSTWRQKLPKAEIMQDICVRENIDPANILVIGDGRSEIAAGTAMGAVCISRLDTDAGRAREIHRALGTNLIIPDYTMGEWSNFMSFIP
jgi:phosphoglycolate phosphatase-like HAD superfamily hydrolase